MGQAKITGGGPTGLYNIEIVKHAGKSAARLTQIAARLTALGDSHGSPVVPGLIVTAQAAADDAKTAMNAAQYALDVLIGKLALGTATRAEVAAATKTASEKRTEWLRKRSALGILQAERAALIKEQTRLQSAMAAESRTGVWCTDLTENLAVGATVGTMEMNGVDDEIILCPGGAVAKSIGLLQHAGVSTPSAVFLNKARLPAWQKWKPTYRTGTITAIDYGANTCAVGIANQFSEEKGLLINQAGAEYSATAAAVSGWTDFAGRNPGFALCTNTASTDLTMTDALRADLETVNNDVNSRNNYRIDEQAHGKLEHWDFMQPGGSGDCEDFALTKARALLALGYPAAAIHIEVGLYNGVGHAWLVIQTDKGDIALDNRYKTLMDNYATPYTARKRQTGMNWKTEGVLLSDVPIEYMDGTNAAAFVAGDSVVVQFTGQAWTAPKVVGFETNPRDGRSLWVGSASWHNPFDVMKYGIDGSLKSSAWISPGATWWALPYSVFGGEIYLPREKAESDGGLWQDALLVRVYDLRTRALKRTLELHFFHIPAFTGDSAAGFVWSSSPLGGGGLGGVCHSASGTLYFAVSWHTFTGLTAWLRSGIYAFNHLTGADMGWYQYTGCRYGLPGGWPPGPIQE